MLSKVLVIMLSGITTLRLGGDTSIAESLDANSQLVIKGQL